MRQRTVSPVADELPEEFSTALSATVAGRGVFGARLIYAAEVGSTNDLASAAGEGFKGHLCASLVALAAATADEGDATLA